MDLVLSRTFTIRDRVALQWRAEAFNIANHPNFDQPVQAFDNSAFGSLTAAEVPRQIQFGLKVKF